MICTHLKQLVELCDKNEIRFSSGEMVHLVCKKCQKEEVCPSMLLDEYEAQHPEADEESEPDETVDESS